MCPGLARPRHYKAVEVHRQPLLERQRLSPPPLGDHVAVPLSRNTDVSSARLPALCNCGSVSFRICASAPSVLSCAFTSLPQHHLPRQQVKPPSSPPRTGGQVAVLAPPRTPRLGLAGAALVLASDLRFPLPSSSVLRRRRPRRGLSCCRQPPNRTTVSPTYSDHHLCFHSCHQRPSALRSPTNTHELSPC